MDLRAEIARAVFNGRESTKWTPEIGERCGRVADAILSILREGGYLKEGANAANPQAD